MSEKTIFSMVGVSKVVPPSREILKDIHLSFFYGAKIGVLGLNGAGKSTLLRVICGEDTDYVGEITAQKGLKFGYLPQEPRLDESLDVRGNVEKAASEIKSLLTEFDEISMKMGEVSSDDELNKLMDRQAQLQEEIERVDGWDLDRKFEIAADALRLPPWDADVSKLSGGEKRRVALCALLLGKNDVLLLDEPTNHLDAESVAWLERYLQEFPGTVIAITHDRYFLDNVAGWILELDRGRGIPYKGNYTAWLTEKEKRLEQEKKQEQAHLRTMNKEREWINQNASGRRKKAKARIERFEELSSKEFQERNATQELYIPPGDRLGEDVIKFNKVSKEQGGKLLFKDLDIKIPRGAIIGIVGPNGAGKTTFLKLITGETEPTSGNVHIGDTVNLAYVNQTRDHLNDSKTIFEEIADGMDNITVGKFTIASRAYVGRFNFKGTMQQKEIGTLSGGERNRVHLAKLLRKGGNVLLLDEPTNDLDVETLRALEEGLNTYPGCVIVVSHDRWFLDRICTHIIAFEGDSEVVYHEGSYTDYEADLKKRRGDDALPHRIKYKPLAELNA